MPDGDLLVVFMTQRMLMRVGDDGVFKVHADLDRVAEWHCNDMVVAANGDAYVGNFGFDLEARARFRTADLALVRVDGTIEVAATGMRFPNGSVITPDGSTLVVGQSFGGNYIAFTIADDATLTDRREDGRDWDSAIARSGAPHIEVQPRVAEAESPFDYASNAEVLIVTDVKKCDLASLAGAYARIIEASGGGVLGLFTAVRRLRAVHGRIADRLARDGLPLYAQHVDPIDTGTLVDIFRNEPRSSLLGTDALRDGVDVPGHSLRMVVMEQVPWPRPSILHRARRHANGGSTYDDSIIRTRLAQAFGRLIRTADDRGKFVVLSPAFPSRLLSAFPPGTPIRRLKLSEALQHIAEHVSEDFSPTGIPSEDPA